MSLTRSTLLLLAPVALFIPTVARAQTPDRAQLRKQIDSLRNELKEKEAQFLAPSDADRAAYSDFLSRRDSGICRLVAKPDFDDKLIRGGGAFYSFTQSSNDYNSDVQVGLGDGRFSTGFAGANYGYITDLGDVPLDAMTAEHPAVRDLAALVTPSAEPDARSEQRRSGDGLRLGNHVFGRMTGASVDHTYILRCVSYSQSDTLVAFRVVRQDDDGSLILIWKILNRFPTPQLIRGDSR
jgi:hypothetical protein